MINLTFKNWFLPFFFFFSWLPNRNSRNCRVPRPGRSNGKNKKSNDAIITQLGMCRALSCFKVLSNWTKKPKTFATKFSWDLKSIRPPSYHRTRSFVWAINMLKMACWKRWRTSFTRLEVAAKFQKKREKRGKGEEDKYINFVLWKMSIKEPQTDGRRVCRHNRTLRLRLPPLFFFSQPNARTR